MLKRSKLLVAFLVVTIICASVGFAAVTDSLFVKGTAGIDVSAAESEFDGDVYFASVTSVVGSNVRNNASLSASVDETNDPTKDTIALNIPADAWASVGDTVTLTAVVQNTNDLDAALSVALADDSDTTNDMSQYISVALGTTTTATAKGETTIEIIFTLKALPSATIDTANSYVVTLTASSVNPTT